MMVEMSWQLPKAGVRGLEWLWPYWKGNPWSKNLFPIIVCDEMSPNFYQQSPVHSFPHFYDGGDNIILMGHIFFFPNSVWKWSQAWNPFQRHCCCFHFLSSSALGRLLKSGGKSPPSASFITHPSFAAVPLLNGNSVMLPSRSVMPAVWEQQTVPQRDPKSMPTTELSDVQGIT